MRQISPFLLMQTIVFAVALLGTSGCKGRFNPLQALSQPVESAPTTGISVPLCVGDLIFVGAAPSPSTESMSHAIATATGSYTHVAIVVASDSVADATPRHGVSLRSIEQFCSELEGTMPVVYRIATAEWDSSALLSRLVPLIGKGYDLYFLPDNDLYYCSELVQHCYLDKQGRPLFPSAPMNFLAPDGTLPAYWQHIFDSLHCPVPQGIPGTNPSDLAISPYLQRL